MNYAKLAVDNISKLGDTDIFPFPIENMMFFDRCSSIVKILIDIEAHFDDWLAKYPVNVIQSCVPVGYTGYRWATLIDPIWNAFLLYQVLKITELIEKERVSLEKKSVFSYRIKLDEDSGRLFDTETNWRGFYSMALSEAESTDSLFVVRFDISDFYNRIYHHRLENAIIRIGADPAIKSRIMRILQDISNNDSYGIPVGGNASRILAELLLNAMDKLMISKRFRFFRYVDDYILFASNREDAYQKLNWCVEYMLRNWGLTLQRSKTQIQTKSEFISHAKANLEGEDNSENKERTDFMKIHIHFDPYSLTAEEDYIKLKDQLEGFDITSLIKDEIRKSRIHLALGKQLMSAILFLDGDKLNLTIKTICANLEVLYPVLPTVMQVLFKKMNELDSETKIYVTETLSQLIEDDSYLFQTENNASYVVRVLSLINSDRSIQAIDYLYTKTSYILVKVNCMFAMANLNNHYWIANLKTRFATFTAWERRAFIAASYFLRDEGKHWREHTKEQFSEIEIELRDWISTKDILKGWRIPL